VGQGALGLECRADDADTQALLEALDHPPTRACVLAERALLRGLGGGCLVPLGAWAVVEGSGLWLRGAVLAPDGSRRIAGEARGPLDQAEVVGGRLAEELIRQGAAEVLGLARASPGG
jgi:hydroxymethylbilane synthase